jgi:hypothetical protein
MPHRANDAVFAAYDLEQRQVPVAAKRNDRLKQERLAARLMASER